MTDFQNISAKISEMLTAAQRCSTDETADNYDLLDEQLGELDAIAKNAVGSHVAYRPLIDKLEKGAPLSDDELTTVKSLIVGDADSYVKYSDDFDRTKSEVHRIIDEIRGLESSELDLQGLMKLRVLCEEASSSLVPALHYVKNKERIQKFEEHTGGTLSKEAGQVLARIIKEKAGQ